MLGFGGYPPLFVVGCPTLGGWFGSFWRLFACCFQALQHLQSLDFYISISDQISLILFKTKTNYGLVINKSARVTFMLKLSRFNDVLNVFRQNGLNGLNGWNSYNGCWSPLMMVIRRESRWVILALNLLNARP